MRTNGDIRYFPLCLMYFFQMFMLYVKNYTQSRSIDNTLMLFVMCNLEFKKFSIRITNSTGL